MNIRKNIPYSTKEKQEKVLHKSLAELKIMSEEDVGIFYKNGIYTLTRLLSLDSDTVFSLTRDNSIRIRQNIMNLGLLFESDEKKFASFGISKDIALIPIDELDMSNTTKRKLARSFNIYFLGDLLVTDYSLLIRARNFGKITLSEIKTCIHSLGYTLLNEEPSIEEVKVQCHSQGKTTIQDDLQLDDMTTSVLFRNEIYTLDDLLSYGYKVFELPCMGPVRKQKLEEAMQRNDVHFDTSCSETFKVASPTKKLIEELKKQTIEIKERVETKNTLVHEYERLLREKSELLEMQKRLDAQISAKIALLDSLNKKRQAKL